MAAAVTLSSIGTVASDAMPRLLPPISDLRNVSVLMAKAVARRAQIDGVAEPM